MTPLQPARSEPIHDVHPLTGVNIEVFYADRTMETFGRGGGPFATSYATYRHAMNSSRGGTKRGAKIEQGKNAITLPLLPPRFPGMETTRPPFGGLQEPIQISR